MLPGVCKALKRASHPENTALPVATYLMDQSYFRAGTHRSYSSTYSCTGKINSCWVLTWPK